MMYAFLGAIMFGISPLTGPTPRGCACATPMPS